MIFQDPNDDLYRRIHAVEMREKIVSERENRPNPTFWGGMLIGLVAGGVVGYLYCLFTMAHMLKNAPP